MRALIVALALLLGVASGPAAAQNRFWLFNSSGEAIQEVNVAPSGQSSWGPDILGSNVLAAGSQFRVTPNSRNCVLDVRVRFASGREETRRGLNACSLNTIVFGGSGRGGGGGSGSAAGSTGAGGAMMGGGLAAGGSASMGGSTEPPVGALATSPNPLLPIPPSTGGITPRRLYPGRVVLQSSQIPPAGVGAYGVFAFRQRPTPASQARLQAACRAYTAALPTQASLPATIRIEDQMLTIWPLLTAGTPAAKDNDCDHLLANYDLHGGQTAIDDARRQGANVSGRGPFLIGWSPSNARGVTDAVVLVVDMSTHEGQQSFDEAMMFWQQKIVEDPQLWRQGFSMERVRIAIREFADRYGQHILESVKLFKPGG